VHGNAYVLLLSCQSWTCTMSMIMEASDNYRNIAYAHINPGDQMWSDHDERGYNSTDEADCYDVDGIIAV
jgi:hypothetical protein